MNKRLLFIPLIMLIGGLVIVFSSADDVIYDDEEIKLLKKLEIEYGSIVKLSVYIDVKDYELIDEEIEYDKLGSLDVNYKIKEDSEIKEKTLRFNVVDTKSPVIIMSNTLSIEVGYEGNLVDKIFSGDNYDASFKKEIVGEYNLNKIGEYPLTIKVEDSNGNMNEKDFTLKVIPKGNNYADSNTYFNDVVKKYKNDNTLVGIDVSKWQGDINFKKVKNSGVSFVMIRLGTQSDFGGNNVLDVKFKQNIKNALDNGLKVGVYFHSYAKTIKEAKEQAKFVIDNLKGYDIEFPVAFDWESWSFFYKLGLSLTDLTKVQEEFLNEISKAGYTGIRYGSKNYLTNAWQDTRYGTWVAHYSSNQTDYNGDYIMWQLCSDGIVDGIYGYVDIDVYYKKEN